MKSEDRAFSRPAARIDDGGGLEVRASAAMGCRRALWYAATGHSATNEPTDEAVTLMEAGNALEPVVLGAMRRAGWEISPNGPANPEKVTVRLAPNLVVSGHPDATGRMPVFGGEEAIVEVKTRGPAAFKRWQAMGAEISHPDAVAQAAVYTHGKFDEARHVVIATMDTASRAWDYEVIPAPRVTTALEKTRAWLGPLGQHLAAAGPDPDALPDRDFKAGGWRCSGCPFLAVCRPGDTDPEVQTVQETEVTEEEALAAVTAYAEAQAAMREPERAKRAALETLTAWMHGRNNGKESIGGRTVSLVRTTRFSVNHRRLSALLDPETRAEVVTEKTSKHIRVS
ncbi:MAG: hypothetical protein OXS35_04225 [Dehalococcoidia bacterium]|nr:hypothetical protein [Dehalococcoidia bacterium]